MAKDVTIVNGTGTADLLNGEYTVTASSTGYDASSINPSTIQVVDGTNIYGFTISGSGTLTIHVTEDGLSTGTAVVGAKFKRTDSTGNEYGDEIITDATGNAVFQYLPYDSTSAPNVYFKQTASDGSHDFSDQVVTIKLSTQTVTTEIKNAPPTPRTINLTDANYANLPIESATITLS